VKRKTLDTVFSVGGVALAGLLAVLGLVMTSNAKFAKDTFGFSVFGVKGEQVATVAYLVAGLLVLLSMAGLAHAFRTSRNETTAALDHPYSRVAVEHRVGV